MNRSDLDRNAYMLRGSLTKRGYMRWHHTFQGVRPDTMETRTFFIDYQLINPSLGAEHPILGQHPYFKKRGMKPSYIMIKAGCYPTAGEAGVQINGFYPVSSLKTTKNPFIFQTEECFYSENHISGFVDMIKAEARHRSFLTDAGFMEWDLEVHKAVAAHMGAIANPLFTAVNALKSFWHGEGIRTFYRGHISLNGVSYEVTPESCYGYADKRWGADFNRPLLHLAASRLTSERTGRQLKHSALVVESCCPRLFFLPLRRRLFIQLTYMGEDFEFHFTNPHTLSRCKWKVKETSKRYIWHIKAQSKNAMIKISVSCAKAQFMEMRYESPDGKLPVTPLLGGSAGTGTIQIYRRAAGQFRLLDTLSLKDALCECQSV
ncbi:MAG: hypothetical protein NC251_07210 [Lachnoclostridium sp.]|nr:hypothetical protein [Lachnospira sp.]MCM1248200.1 hypothetical protein [Lachnoclostridium sp.]MCM1534483.1 hypothetical protein [Clostridium sp.]